MVIEWAHVRVMRRDDVADLDLDRAVRQEDAVVLGGLEQRRLVVVRDMVKVVQAHREDALLCHQPAPSADTVSASVCGSNLLAGGMSDLAVAAVCVCGGGRGRWGGRRGIRRDEISTWPP